MKSVTKSWKTTLLGLIAGIGMMAGQRLTDPTAPAFTAGNVLPGIAVMLMGAVAKDGDKTGL